MACSKTKRSRLSSAAYDLQAKKIILSRAPCTMTWVIELFDLHRDDIMAKVTSLTGMNLGKIGYSTLVFCLEYEVPFVTEAVFSRFTEWCDLHGFKILRHELEIDFPVVWVKTGVEIKEDRTVYEEH